VVHIYLLLKFYENPPVIFSYSANKQTDKHIHAYYND